MFRLEGLKDLPKLCKVIGSEQKCLYGSKTLITFSATVLDITLPQTGWAVMVNGFGKLLIDYWNMEVENNT